MKPIGMKLYYAVPGTVTATTSMTFTELYCLVEYDPPGVSANVEEIEPCLSDTLIVEEPTTPKHKQTVATLKLRAGETQHFDDLYEYCISGTKLHWAVLYPGQGTTTTTVYCNHGGYLADVSQVTTDRNNDMKYTISIAPTAGIEWSTTAPV